jgi:hypothetical protein
MLRIDSENTEHREALRDALCLGVDLFDLGDFATDPARFEARSNLLLGLIAEYTETAAKTPVRILVRGNLGVADRLKLTADSRVEWIYLIADPEFALGTLDWDHSRLYSLLAYELDTLEDFARTGVITSYGVASAALTYPKESPDAIALEPIVFNKENIDWDSSAAAPRPENRKHFGYVEFPFNLYESEAATEETQLVGARHETLLIAAKAWNLTTIGRRPFDAITEDGLRRLVAYPDHHRLDLDEAVKLTLEKALAAEAVLPMAFPAGGWAHTLRQQLKHVNDPEQWKEIVQRKIEPALRQMGTSQDLDSEELHYLDAMNALILSVKLWCEKIAAERNERLRAKIVEASSSLGRKRLAEDRDLALLSLRIYRSIPGLDHVLVGMRSPRYVGSLLTAQKNFSADQALPVEEVQAVLVAVHREFQKGTP